MSNKKAKKSKLIWLIIIPIIALLIFVAVSIGKDSGSLSKKDAIAKVRILPEVSDYLKRVPSGQISVNGEEDNGYMVQVFEVKDGHTATFNWYTVDKTTGEIKNEF